jgi:PAS domain-containing protein
VKNSEKILTSIFNRTGIESSGQVALTQSTGIPPHVRLVILIALTVFVCETLVMFILSYLPSFPSWFHALFDATLLVVLLSPVLYLGLFRTLVRYISRLQRAEETIRKQRDTLDKQVMARTAELSAANAMLKREITERQRTEDELKRELELNAALSELYKPLISPSATIDGIASTILDKAKSLTQSEHGYVSSIDPANGNSLGHTLTEMLKDQCQVSEDNKVVFPLGADGRYHGLWGHSLNTLEPFYTNSPQSHFASAGVPRGHIPVERLLSVPVILGEAPVGQIALANKGADYTDQDLEAIGRVAEFYALAIQRSRAEEALQSAKGELEKRVEGRTAELAQANTSLMAEINERIRVQAQIEQSKAMLQAIFDGISDPLILMDANMKVKMVNRTAADYYGIGQPQDILKGSCHQVLKGSLSACEGCEVPGAIISGKSLMFERPGFMDPDRLEHVFVYPVKGKGGQGDDVLLRISDITEQRMFEKKLIQSEKMSSLGILVSSIAHEINNPNNFISFNIPILKDYIKELMPIADTYAETHPNLEIGNMAYPEFRNDISNLLDNIAHGSERINSFVSNLKEFSQVKDKVKEEWIDLNSVIEKVLSICRVQLKKKVDWGICPVSGPILSPWSKSC